MDVSFLQLRDTGAFNPVGASLVRIGQLEDMILYQLLQRDKWVQPRGEGDTPDKPGLYVGNLRCSASEVRTER